MDFNTLVQNFIENYGLASIFIIVMLEYANLPLPSELVLPFVGLMVSDGIISLSGAVMVSIIAGIVGSVTNYYLGYYFGTPIIKTIISKYPKAQKSAQSSYSWLQKYGKISVMITRIVPIARTFISIPAGISKMKLSIFIIYSGIGIGLWNVFLISLGYCIGDNISLVVSILNNYSIIVVSIAIIILVLYFIFMKKKN